VKSQRSDAAPIRTSPFLVIFLLSLLLRLLYLASRWSALPYWNVDALGYHQLALNLLERGIFSLNSHPPFQPDAIRVPGYPVFTALTYSIAGASPRVVLVMQAVLDSLTTLLAMGIALKLTRSRRATIISGVLYAVCPLAWRYCAELYVETVLACAIAAVYFGLAHIMEQGDTLSILGPSVLGVACAFSLYVKANVLLLPIMVSLVLWIKGSFRQAVVSVVTLILLIAPWVIRNTIVFGRPMLSTVFENNLARVSAPATLAELRRENVAPWTPRWEELFLEVVDAAAVKNPVLFAAPMDELTPRQIDQVQIETARVARDIITRHPAAFVTSHVRGAFRGLLPQGHRFWFAQLSGQTWDSVMPNGMMTLLLSRRWRDTPPLALALFTVFVLIYALGLAVTLRGAWRLCHSDPVIASAMLLFIGYMIILPGPIAYERFQVPIMPLVLVLTACVF